MLWRDLEYCIKGVVHARGFNNANVEKLSKFCLKLRIFPKGVLVMSQISNVCASGTCDPILRCRDNTDMGRGGMYLNLCIQCYFPCLIAVVSFSYEIL
jgi:hypothetical protein